MPILGISAFYHDSAACLVHEGEVVAASQEERFTRKTHDPGFPHRAVQSCLAQAGIGITDIKYIVFYGLVTPIGVSFQLMGKNTMHTVFEKESSMYRVVKTKRPCTHMKYQF